MRETPPITTGHPWVKSDFTQFLPRWIRNKRYFVFDGDWWRIYESTKTAAVGPEKIEIKPKRMQLHKCTDYLFWSTISAWPLKVSNYYVGRASARQMAKYRFRVIEFSHGEAEILNELWAHTHSKKFFKGPDANCRSLSEKKCTVIVYWCLTCAYSRERLCSSGFIFVQVFI